MRKAINISLPPSLATKVKKAVSPGKYASISEFFRDLLRQWAEDQELYQDVMKSEQEFSAVKGKKLRSLSDLR